MPLCKGAIALQMPAGRGQLFTAVYQISSVGLGLTPLVSDGVMNPDDWKQTLDALDIPYQLIDVPTDLGNFAVSLLELAELDWQEGIRPHWSDVSPFYGQHPVDNR